MVFPVVRDEKFDELQIIVVPDLTNQIIIDVDKSYICVNHLTHQYFYPDTQDDRHDTIYQQNVLINAVENPDPHLSSNFQHKRRAEV
jgi:hypothetical protein